MTVVLRMARVDRRVAILAGIALILAVACLWRGLAPIERPPLPAIPETVTAAVKQADRGTSAAGSLSGDFIEAAERPLFNANRKRFVEPVVPVQAQPAVSMQPFRMPALLGVAGSGDRRVALIKLPDERESRRLRVGDIHDGWAVSEIGRDVIVFGNGGERREVRLLAEKNTGTNMAGGMPRR